MVSGLTLSGSLLRSITFTLSEFSLSYMVEVRVNLYSLALDCLADSILLLSFFRLSSRFMAVFTLAKLT